MPAKSTYGGKLNLHYKQPNVHVRSFIDLFKGPVAAVDLTLGHEGFLVGAEGGYDVQKAAITKYSLAAGYSQGSYAAAITATNNLTIFSASYYHKVNTEVEAGAKATWDSAAGSNVGLEVASKYKLDPSSFAKVRKLPAQIARQSQMEPELTLPLCYRPRSMTAVSLLLHTMSSSARASPSVLARHWTHRTSAKLHTRLVHRSLSKDKLLCHYPFLRLAI